jgi:hypothetical protein
MRGAGDFARIANPPGRPVCQHTTSAPDGGHAVSTGGTATTMHTHIKLALSALVAALALSAAAGNAAARRFEVSERRFEITFEAVGYRGGGLSIECRATMQGSFHSRTISKVSGQLIGYITEAKFAHPCREAEGWLLNGVERRGEITFANTLPWHIMYLAFSGALPRIQRIAIGIAGYAYLEFCINVSCLYKSTTSMPLGWELELNEGRLTGVRWDEGRTFPLFEGGVLCPTTVTLTGSSARVGTPETFREIIVRLVE